jgi:hypothetical protein
LSTGLVVLAWIGLAAALFVLVQVLVLLNRVLRPLREIKRYADETLAAGIAIAKNLDDVDEAARTRELVAALPEAVAPVAKRLGAH